MGAVVINDVAGIVVDVVGIVVDVNIVVVDCDDVTPFVVVDVDNVVIGVVSTVFVTMDTIAATNFTNRRIVFVKTNFDLTVKYIHVFTSFLCHCFVV